MKLAILFSALISLGLISKVSAEEFPNMVGTWEGTSEALIFGNALYYQ